jgi:hypothetical protein
MAMEQRRYWRAIELIWESVSIYVEPDAFLRSFRDAPERSRNLLAAHWCQSEVSNGGFLQFFYNPTGVLAPEAAEGVRSLGMLQIATVIERAIAWFGTAYPRKRDHRIAVLAPYHPRKRGNDPFEQLDLEFLHLLDTESGGFIHAANRYADQELV